MKGFFRYLLALALLPGFGPASDAALKAQPTPPGDVRLFAPPEIERMVQEHRRINEEEGALSGYRIQLFASPVYARSREFLAGFATEYPDISVQILLEEPDFKVMAGAYTDRFEAHRELVELQGRHPGAFLVRQLVRIAEL
jgi:hypothetical protein